MFIVAGALSGVAWLALNGWLCLALPSMSLTLGWEAEDKMNLNDS
jgi:hypothetical protein